MLSKLKIKNYALISEINLDLHPGLTIITGKTGAGKSIILGALSLLLGARADISKIIRPDRGKTVVEGVFNISDENIAEITGRLDIDVSDSEIILRREISATGKSRAFINDSPVTLKDLAETGAALVDIHSQHANLLLTRQQSILSILDSMASSSDVKDAYTKAYKDYVAARKSLQNKRDEIAKAKESEELVRFQLEMLERLKPKSGEREELTKQSELLSDAGTIKENLDAAAMLLSEADVSALNKLYEAIGHLSKVNQELFAGPQNEESMLQRSESVYVELKDIASTVRRMADGIEADPELLQKVEARIDAINDTCRRFKVKTDGELVEIYERLKRQMRAITDGGDDIPKFSHEAQKAADHLRDAVGKLSAQRDQAARRMSSEVLECARQLGLPNLKFKVDLSRTKLDSTGGDAAQLLCSFNKNQTEMPLSEVASGGEMSRLMLGIKATVGTGSGVSTVIFDEIDTGVSGEIADKMGEMMRRMADSVQVIAITHLPQVAAKGDDHIKVFKKDEVERTTTYVERLTAESRREEIAGMLSGSVVDDAALMNADSLLKKSKRQ